MTGCSPWTVYEDTNYKGASVCFYPLDTRNCYPAFYSTPGVMGGIADKYDLVVLPRLVQY